MDLLSVGNLNHYIKNLKLQTQWSLKQQNGTYTAKGSSLDEWLDRSLSQAQKPDSATGDHGDDTLRKIHQKLESGGKLTPRERDYLQEHDPEAYRELVNLEREQKAYERKLRRCKTQEEVEQLRMTQINASLTRVQAVEHNPHISQSQKLEIAMTEKQRVDRVAESTREFARSGAYAKLPSRAEEMEANENAINVPPLPPEESQSSSVKDMGPDQESERLDKTAGIDVETPAERKVRWAKARAAYAPFPQPTIQPAPGRVEFRT